MKFNSKIKFLQDGGTVAPSETATPSADQAGAQQSGGEDPLVVLGQMAATAIQNNDSQLAFQVCQGYLQILQQMAGESGGSEPAPQGEPVYKKGGKLAYRMKN